jgi:CDP-glycerol glycerophosphotransferase (TagB/SpsB family)
MVLKACAYINKTEVHHLDHIGVLAATLDIPLITSDLKLYYLGKQFYPGLNICYMSSDELSAEALVNSFDLIFITNFWDKPDFDKFFEDTKKKIRYVYCSHGNSDKGQTYPVMERFLLQDITLIYGMRMLDFLKEKGVTLNDKVICGNYRLNYYKKYKEFYDSIPLPIPNTYCKKILFAPTWNPQDSCLFQDLSKLIDDIPDDFALIFKVHPAFERDFFFQYTQVEELFNKKENIFILKDFPIIYPLLEKVDCYVGDSSSISYDALYFNKPIYFINSTPQIPSTYIHQAGTILDSHFSLFDQIKSNDLLDDRFTEIRKEMFAYTFQEGISDSDIWNGLEKILSKAR